MELIKKRWFLVLCIILATVSLGYVLNSNIPAEDFKFDITPLEVSPKSITFEVSISGKALNDKTFVLFWEAIAPDSSSFNVRIDRHSIDGEIMHIDKYHISSMDNMKHLITSPYHSMEIYYPKGATEGAVRFSINTFGTIDIGIMALKVIDSDGSLSDFYAYEEVVVS